MENEILKEIRGLNKEIIDLRKFSEEKFDQVDKKINNMNERIDNMDEKINNMNERIDNMDEKINKMDEKIDKMEKNIITEYHSFIDTVNRVHSESNKALKDEISQSVDKLNEYQAKVKNGIKLFQQAVG